MDDVPGIVAAVRAALSALHSRTASPLTVKEAQARLGQIKEALDPSSVIAIVELLLRPVLAPSASVTSQRDVSIPEIHYGFHLLDEIILRATCPWASFPDHVRASVRQISIFCVQQVSQLDSFGNYSSSFPSFVVEKAVALLSSVAVREWPQRWPSFLDDLLADPRRAEVSCHVLRVLSEDVHDFPDLIEPSRRQELHHAMALTLPQTLGYIIASANTFHQQNKLDSLRSVLACLESFLSWAPLQSVFGAGAPQACLTLLGYRETRQAALSALKVLVQRHFLPAVIRADGDDSDLAEKQMVQSDSAFRDIVFTGLIKFAATPTITSLARFSLLPSAGAMPGLAQAEVDKQEPGELDEDEYEFQVNFFEVLSVLGGSHFTSSFLFSRTKKTRALSAADKQCGAAYVDLMLSAAAGPSLVIRSSVVSFFVSVMNVIAKQKTSTPLEGLAAFLAIGYLHAGALGLVQFPNDNMRNLCDEMDFGGDPRRHRDVLENFKARSISCIGIACKLVPKQGGPTGLRRLLQLLTTPPEQASSVDAGDIGSKSGAAFRENSPRLLGYIRADGTQHGWEFGKFDAAHRPAWVAALEASIAASEAMIAGVTASRAFGEQHEIFALMQAGFDLVLRITEGSLLPVKATALRIFLPLYITNPLALQCCIESLISQISSCPAKSFGRFKACSSLSVLCRRLGSSRVQSISQFRKPLCEYSAQALISSQFQAVNKILLLESSIETVLVMDNISEQADWIEKLMHPLLETLSSDAMHEILLSPVSLFEFVMSASSGDLTRVVEAFQIMESGTHQIVRPLSKAAVKLQFPSVLSRSIAPKGVDACSSLVVALHGMYNISKFPLDDPLEARRSVLYPTSKEISYLLNLEGSIQHSIRGIALDFREDGTEQQPAVSSEQRSDEILRQFGVEPPDARHSGPRETLKNLRRSAYEVLRGAILSGVTQSPSHLKTLLTAISVDYQYIEPIHLLLLTSRVLRPLLSFSVVSADPTFFHIVASSDVHAVLKMIREHVESAKLGEIVSSEAATLDVARDHGRKMLARAAADMVFNMYPRIETGGQKKGEAAAKPEEVVYVPPAFNHSLLGSELITLWGTLCSPGRGFLDNGAARVAFNTVTSAVQLAPDAGFSLFAPLLQASLQTAIQNDGLGTDSPLENAIGAVLAIIRKWPTESQRELSAELAKYGNQVVDWVAECILSIAGSNEVQSKPKKHRAALRTLAGRIAELAGVSRQTRSKVHALPEKLVTTNPSRSHNRSRPGNELEEIVLGDQALDSLFGEGDPL